MNGARKWQKNNMKKGKILVVDDNQGIRSAPHGGQGDIRGQQEEWDGDRNCPEHGGSGRDDSARWQTLDGGGK